MIIEIERVSKTKGLLEMESTMRKGMSFLRKMTMSSPPPRVRPFLMVTKFGSVAWRSGESLDSRRIIIS